MITLPTSLLMTLLMSVAISYGWHHSDRIIAWLRGIGVRAAKWIWAKVVSAGQRLYWKLRPHKRPVPVVDLDAMIRAAMQRERECSTKVVLLFALLLIPSMLQAACPNGDTTHAGNECIVSATGSGSTCSAASPCSFTGWYGTAAAGDQVWVMDTGGIYKARYEIPASTDGSAGNHIIIRNHCGADHICDTADDHHPKFDSYQTTTLTSNMKVPGDGSYNVDCTVGSNTFTVADGSVIQATTPQDTIHLGTGARAERVAIFDKSGNTINNCLREWDGSGKSALSGNIDSSVTTIPVDTGYYFQAGDTILIDSEKMTVGGVSGSNLTSVTRAAGGTSAASHTSGTTVYNVTSMTHISGDTVKVFGTNIAVYGAYLTLQGLEIYNSYDERAFSAGVAGDVTTKRGSCIFYGNNQAGSLVRLVDLVLHDCNHGLFTASDSATLEFIDILDFNQGLVNSDPNGLGWYTENTDPETKLFSNIIALNNYSSCGKLYSESLGNAQNFTVQDVICANSGAPIAAKSSGRPAGFGTSTRTNGLQLGGGGAPNITGNTFQRNHMYFPLASDAFYFSCMWFGYLLSTGTANNNSFTDNYCVGPQPVNIGPLGTNVTFTGNTVVQPLVTLAGSSTIVSAFRQSGNTGWTVNNNTYYDRRQTESTAEDGTTRYSFSYSTNSGSPLPTGCCRNAPGGGGSSGASQLAFTSSVLVTGQSPPQDGSANSPSGSGWKQWSGFDSSSSYTGGSLPSSNVKGCVAKTYGMVGGYCYIYNWDGSASVTLTISGLGLSDGDSFAVYDAQNWTSWQTSDAIVTGTYSASAPTVSIPMSTLSTVKKPLGTSDTIAHTANGGAVGGFGAFIVLKSAAGAGGGGIGGAGGWIRNILWVGAVLLITVALRVLLGHGPLSQELPNPVSSPVDIANVAQERELQRVERPRDTRI